MSTHLACQWCPFLVGIMLIGVYFALLYFSYWLLSSGGTYV
jgi:hypothetical protein